MPLRLYNTLTKQTEPFVPIEPNRVTFYSCGPTVYDFAHIGNFRSFLAADLLRRWLESPLCERADGSGGNGGGGYQVTQVMNITDVGHMTDDDTPDGAGEDKMEAARARLLESKKSGKLPPGASESLDPNDPYGIANFYADAFLEDARTLGMKVVDDAVARPELMPRPTRVIAQMLEMILDLVDKDHAYVALDGVAYFATQSFPPYGKLSGNTLEDLRSGAGGRVSAETQQIKQHPADFMLWKPDPAHLMRWDPPQELAHKPELAAKVRELGLKEGYPGWHLECSVMARDVLGDEIDLHSGGEDNIFPHHECEIAQSCCATGRNHFARYWFHPRFLQVEGAKMSKSKGNFFTLRDLTAKGFSPAAIRLELIKTHYRANANFTEQGLKDSARMITRLRDFLSRADASTEPGAPNKNAAAAFARSMDDDLNIAGAIGTINSWINDTPTPTHADGVLLRTFDAVLGVVELPDIESSVEEDPEAGKIEDLLRRRTKARASKDWAAADEIRDQLDAMSVVVEDSPDGPKWTRKVQL